MTETALNPQNYTHAWLDLKGYASDYAKLHMLIANKKLPQALILHGRDGIGKSAFAHAVAAALYCPYFIEGNAPCGTCFTCIEICRGSFIDLRVLDQNQQLIRNHMVKELFTHLDIRPRFVGKNGFSCRIIILICAENLSHAAINSILKVVEEPPQDSLIIFTTGKLAHVKDTLRSRCVHWWLHPPRSMNQIQRKIQDSFLSAASQEEVRKVLCEYEGGCAAEILAVIEICLNALYRRQLAAKKLVNMVELRDRRKWLGDLKHAIIQNKITINVQLILDRFIACSNFQ